MSTNKYVDVLLAQNANGENRTFVMPTSIAYEGDVIFHNGALFTVLKHAWFDVNDDTYSVMKGSTTFYIPDKILKVHWEKKNETEVDNGEKPGDS